MDIALLTLDIHLPAAQSLKDRREVVRSLKDRLRAKFNVAVAEVGETSLWQRAQVAVVSVNADHTFLEKMMTAVDREAEDILRGQPFESHLDFI
ncbi:MAG: DUF503 domain-containing protein [Acidobacteriia bacterium]|nr:DUF503 domain-containing protein [Terriglobia bacterium]